MVFEVSLMFVGKAGGASPRFGLSTMTRSMTAHFQLNDTQHNNTKTNGTNNDNELIATLSIHDQHNVTIL